MLEEHELDIDAAPVGFEEALEARRDLTALSAAPLQLLGNVLRCIARPALAGVEADDADRAAYCPSIRWLATSGGSLLQRKG